MAFYLFECTNKECCNKEEIFRTLSRKDDPAICKRCGFKMKRIFHPKSGGIVFWKSQKNGSLTNDGPTRRNNYTIGDIAEENNWYDQWGVDKVKPKKKRDYFYPNKK